METELGARVGIGQKDIKIQLPQMQTALSEGRQGKENDGICRLQLCVDWIWEGFFFFKVDPPPPPPPQGHPLS